MAPIIRTCSLLIAGTLGFAIPALAMAAQPASPLAAYVRARAADAAGAADLAARQYAMALESAPDDGLLAGRTYRQAVIAGDQALALRAARALEAGGKLPYEGRLLLFAEAIAQRDWKAAEANLTRIEKDKAFGFAAPILRAWLGQASGASDPLARLRGPASEKAMEGYQAEHRVLILLAQGRIDAAEASLAADGAGSSARDDLLRLRIARARTGTPQGIDAGFGLSQLYLRLALDFNRERMSGLAILLAQFSVFAAPAHDEARLAAAQLLAANQRHEAALSLLDRIITNPGNIASIRSARVRILLAQGRNDEALALVENAMSVAPPGTSEWALLGDVRSSLGQHAKAAEAYGRAIATLPAGEGDRLPDLLLLQGGALEQAGDWPSARRLLEQAVALAPDRPVALNYLGYAQLARRENVASARKLIERALELRPGDAAITDSLGWAQYLEGDLPGAIARLEAAALGDPGGSEINEHLGDAYWSAGRRVEARFAWSAALVTAEGDAKARLARKLDTGLEDGERAP